MDLFDFNFDASDANEPEAEPEPVAGAPVALSVSAAVELINQQLFGIAGPDLMVEGEVSEFAISQGKWVRFTLKDTDGGALLKCFLTIHATPKIYPRYGQFTLNVNSIELQGEGALAKQLERLRLKLDQEGLFDPARKRELPRYPSRIGLVASRESAAYTDFLRILQNRWGGVQVDSYHVHVQGERAVPEIVGTLQAINALPEDERPDVLVLTRGGGALEDLMAFNDEAVVRAVFASAVPIVVGIGHERDESLAELAADVRASTPSNAAERVVPDREAIERQVDMTAQRLLDVVQDQLQRKRHAVDTSVHRLERVMQMVRYEVERAMGAVERMGTMLLHDLASAKDRVASLARYLNEMDPQRVLKRGYAIVRKDKAILKDVSAISQGDQIHVQLANGTLTTTVTE